MLLAVAGCGCWRGKTAKPIRYTCRHRMRSILGNPTAPILLRIRNDEASKFNLPSLTPINWSRHWTPAVWSVSALLPSGEPLRRTSIWLGWNSIARIFRRCAAEFLWKQPFTGRQISFRSKLGLSQSRIISGPPASGLAPRQYFPTLLDPVRAYPDPASVPLYQVRRLHQPVANA